MIFYEIEGENIRFFATDLDTLILTEMIESLIKRKMGYKFEAHEFEETTILKIYIDRDIGYQERRMQVQTIMDLYRETKKRRKK